MAETPIDAQTLKDLPQGAMETLLSTARAETGAAVAFVALYRADGSFAITTSMEDDVPWEGRSLASLARSIWLDPDLSVGKVLVSSARIEGGRMKRRQAHVASVVLSDSTTSDLEWGLLSIIAHNDRKFTEQQVDRIVALSKNLATYLSARERMIDGLMDAVRDDLGKPSTTAAGPGEIPIGLEEMMGESALEKEAGTPRSRAVEAEKLAAAGGAVAEPETQPEPEPEVEATGETGEVGDIDGDASAAAEVGDEAEVGDVAGPGDEAALDDQMQTQFEDLAARAGTNGVHDTPARTFREQLDDGISAVDGTDDVKDEDAVTNAKGGTDVQGATDVTEATDMDEELAEMTQNKAGTAAAAVDETPPALTIQVGEPGLVSYIGDAMDAIGEGVESVALIHLKITYDDTLGVVPTEAARVLVAQSIKNCVRYEDKVARVGENSYVIVARLRPGSPKPDVIEARMVTSAQTATGWGDGGTGPSFRTDHLVVDPESIDDPEDVLLSLLHP
jgi:hypothetical protein